MAVDSSADEESGQERPEAAVKNRSRRIRKIKHSDDFEYNNLGLDDQLEDSTSSKKRKRGRTHLDDDDDFAETESPKKAKKTPSDLTEVDAEQVVSLKKTLAKMGIPLPKKPKAGYVAYVTSIRDSVAAKYPQATFGDLTHLLAEEWNKLPQEEKKKHLDKARQEKEKYINDLKELEKKHGIDLSALTKLRRRRGCKPFSEKVRSVLARNKSTMFARKSLTSEEKYLKALEHSGDPEGEETPEKQRRRRTASAGGEGEPKRRRGKLPKQAAEAETDEITEKEEKGECEDKKEKKEKVKPQRKPRVKKVEMKRKFRLNDVPKVEAAIFTDDFLEINKGREAELRQLKKTVGDLEEQTVALRHHVTCLEDSHSYLEESVNQARKLNSDLSHFVVDLSNAVVKHFAKIKLPGCGDLTHGNIGRFTEELIELLDKGGKEAAGILKMARAVAANLELPV